MYATGKWSLYPRLANKLIHGSPDTLLAVVRSCIDAYGIYRETEHNSIKEEKTNAIMISGT